MRGKLLAQLQRIVNSQAQTIALDIDDQALTYRELCTISKHYAKQLKGILEEKASINDKPRVPVVALHFCKSTEFVIAQISCWIAGAAFLPLDVEWPEQRKQLAIKAAGCKVLAYKEDTKNISSFTDTQIRPWSISSKFKPVHVYDGADSVIDKNHKEDLAYVIFSSGSSGEPKGITVSFDGLNNILKQQLSVVGIKQNDRTLWVHHPCFDASIADVWVALLAGSTIVANSDLNPLEILPFAKKYHIAYIDLPASLMSLLPATEIPKNLKTVLVGGEVISLDVLKKWHEKVQVVIAYGPSEATICTSMHVILGDEEHLGLIGKPIPGIDYLVVDQDDNVSETGELIIVGDGVALGYLNAEAALQSRFFKIKGRRAYRTGDLVQKLDANYQFTGRADRQFKINGKLVRPEEIEHVLLRHPKISDAYVFSDHNQSVNGYCIAISTNLDIPDLTSCMKAKLPNWMCSPRWIFLNLIPRNANGKIDRSLLLSRCVASPQKKDGESRSAAIVNIIQRYAKHEISLDMIISQLPIDSIQWLMILIDIRDSGVSTDTNRFYNVLSDHRACVADLVTLGGEKSDTQNSGRDSSELLPLISHFLDGESNSILGKVSEQGDILITGATGQLGRNLLSELVNSARKIFLLVRENGVSLNEIESEFKTQFLNKKLHAVYGDITKERFGLDESEWNELSKSVSDVYHCAADTNILKPLEELFSTNVEGCHQIVRFCKNQKSKRLHYASTLAVVVDSNWKYKQVDESNTLSDGYFYGGYVQSKWLAEQLIQKYPNANIFRFGLLVTKPKIGVKIADLFGLRLKSMSIASQVPANASFDFTPIEQAAKLMFLICLLYTSPSPRDKRQSRMPSSA